MLRFNDPLLMPITLETPHERLARGLPLAGSPGELYVERRSIPLAVADQAGVRFDPDWQGRPAVITPMYDLNGNLCSVHGRYLQQLGKENKMFTIGPGGGMVQVLGGIKNDPIIIVEGLFDALSLAVCGYGSLATVGRHAPWLADICAGKKVLLGFDANKPGEADVKHYQSLLKNANCYRIIPPHHCKDWNTALVKRGAAVVTFWLRNFMNNLEHRS
ncbi:hypothetical protein D3C80_206270 [compost metagenome]